MTKRCFKIIVVGNQGSGKTCFIRRLISGRFTQNYMTTIGIEFQSKELTVDQECVQLQIWDTAGQEKFRSLVRSFYHNSICAIFVYAIDDRRSFDALDHWVTEARANVVPECALVLIGAKKDLEIRRTVSYEEGLGCMKRHNLDMFFETSAMNGENVQLAFELLTRELIQKAVKQNKLSRILSQERVVLTQVAGRGGCCG